MEGYPMKNIWQEREKALENQFVYQEEKKKFEQMRADAREQLIREYCRNRCPKCGEPSKP